jgi:hypothetical protein
MNEWTWISSVPWVMVSNDTMYSDTAAYCLTRSKLMADLNIIVGEQAYECALSKASVSGQ